jgi:hypothetical protein
MTDSVRFQFERQISLLFQRRFTEMLDQFDLPFAMQIGGEMSVHATQAEFVDALTIYRDWLDDAGVTALSVRLSAIELPRQKRFRIWADLDHRLPSGVQTAADQLIVYCRQEESEYRVELIHCVRLSMLASARAPRALLA